MNGLEKGIHMIVHGNVQGVGFRYFTQEAAAGLGIKGWVKNREDGDVEIAAEGPEDALDRFVEKIKGGPSPFSKVEDCTIEPLEEPLNTSSFRIKY